jgi:hypothetical protein
LELERRDVPSRPLPYPVIYVGAETGAPPAVKAYDAETGKLNFERTAYESTFTGGVRVATADFTGDGFPDLAVAAGEGGGPRVRILDGKTGKQIDGPLGNFFAFSPDFKGGVEVAAGDVTGDNVPDLIVAAGKSGGPHVRVFDGQTGQAIMNFMAFDPDFRGGVSIAAADFTLDGKSELVVGAGFGGGPHVKTFDVATGQTIPGPLGNFFAFEPEFRGGVRVGTDWKTGDFGGDGRADLAVGPGPGRSPDVKLYSGATGQLLRQFAAFDATMTAGVRVALAYVSDDAMADVVVATGVGVPNQVRVFDTKTNQLMTDHPGVYTPFGPTNANGLTLAATNDPPNKYGYFDLPVNETFVYIPQEAELIYNNYEVYEHVFVENDRLRWELTVTNTSMDFNDYEWPHDLTDDGLGVFQIPTRTTSGVIVVDNKNEWYGAVTSTKGEEGYIRWEGEPIFVNESVQLVFTTPLLSPVLDWSTAAATLLPPPGNPWPLQSTTILQVAVPGPKVEIMATYGYNNSYEALDLYVAKWHDAFKASANGSTVEINGPTQGSNYDFIDRDYDRFNVWVKDVAKWTATNNNIPAFPHIKATLSTNHVAADAFYNDDPTQISLARYTGANKEAGWYWSDSQILVSNSTDDLYDPSYIQYDDTPPSGTTLQKNGHIWELSDRTHTVSLGGEVKAEYAFASSAISKYYEVQIKKYVKLHINILRVTAGGSQVTTDLSVVDDIEKANEIFAQTGIKIYLNGSINVVNPPYLVVLSDGSLDETTKFDSNNNIILTTEEANLLGATSYRTTTDNEGKDDIEVYYVNALSKGSIGESFPEMFTPDSKYNDSIIIASNRDYQTLAHEMMHILMNSGEHFQLAPPNDSVLDSVNVYVEGKRSRENHDVLDSRRITSGQQVDLISKRPNLIYNYIN